jgi:hypothetical protein
VRRTSLTGVAQSTCKNYSYEVQCLTGLTGHHHRSDRWTLSTQVFEDEKFKSIISPIHPPLGDIKVLSRRRDLGRSGQQTTAWQCLDLLGTGLWVACIHPAAPSPAACCRCVTALPGHLFMLSWCSGAWPAEEVLGLGGRPVGDGETACSAAEARGCAISG